MADGKSPMANALMGHNPSATAMNPQPSAVTATPPEKLPRTLGLWSSIALVVGITIGSGIFRSPAGIARQAANPLVMLGLWVAGGVVTLCGALSLAEIAA